MKFFIILLFIYTCRALFANVSKKFNVSSRNEFNFLNISEPLDNIKLVEYGAAQLLNIEQPQQQIILTRPISLRPSYQYEFIAAANATIELKNILLLRHIILPIVLPLIILILLVLQKHLTPPIIAADLIEIAS